MAALIVYAAILAGAGIGAWIGWRHGSKTQTPYWAQPYREDHVSREQHAARLRRRWRMRRLAFTAVLSFMGAMGVVLLLTVVQFIGSR
ncbi:MAG TPA: hypothetical protein VMI56_25830 [Reyranella sp.]|nr:hypothetical protein [Reyranella sp.]